MTYKNTYQLEQIQARLITSGLSSNYFILSKLLQACDHEYSVLIFNHLEDAPTFIWNTMIQKLVDQSCTKLAFTFYMRMMKEGAKPNNYTFPSLLKTCTDLSAFLEGTQLHCHIVKLCDDHDEFLYSSLIRMYCTFGDVVSGRKVFDQMPHRNVVCWTSLLCGYVENGNVDAGREVFEKMPGRDVVVFSAMISGYVHGQRYREALGVLLEMQAEFRKPNEGVLVGVIAACAGLRALKYGASFHSYMGKMGFGGSINVMTALVDMYAKCGEILDGIKLFDEMHQRSLLSWNVMVTGLAMHGKAKNALGVYTKMLKLGIRPDGVTFLGLLDACSHGGLVVDGISLFEGMTCAYFIEPQLGHFGCIVDLLSRAGLLQEANKLVEEMPMKPDARIWGALLAGCRIHGDTDTAERIAERAVESQPDHAGRYMLLSNVYTWTNRWSDAVQVRELMARRGVKVRPGCSSVEVQGSSLEENMVDDLVDIRKTSKDINHLNGSRKFSYSILVIFCFKEHLRTISRCCLVFLDDREATLRGHLAEGIHFEYPMNLSQILGQVYGIIVLVFLESEFLG
ncbi:Pentatricopeptide repeat-containing protein [Nymphaea thermarum]|nr:Pentatricopeptide repeat-containing protein [Nymphaea thermarum]